MTRDDWKTNRFIFAGVSTLTVLAWYALPDFVRSRTARGVIKAGLLVVSAAGTAMIPEVYPEAKRLKPPRVDLGAPAMIALSLGVLTASTALTVWLEKAIFARGERRRARGVRAAHTPAAVALAVATGATAVVDWPAVVRRATAR